MILPLIVAALMAADVYTTAVILADPQGRETFVGGMLLLALGGVPALAVAKAIVFAFAWWVSRVIPEEPARAMWVVAAGIMVWPVVSNVLLIWRMQ